MAIDEKEQSTQDKQALSLDLAKKSSDLAASIIKTYDLPTSIADAVDKEHDKGDTVDNEVVEETTEESSEESGSEGAEELSPEQDETESKPDSVQKRIDELTREKRQLEARLKKLESANEPKTESSDLITQQLNEMPIEKLQELREEVLWEQRNATTREELKKLFDVEQKALKAIETFKPRFEAKQVEKFNEIFSQTRDELSEQEIQVVALHAKELFLTRPLLKNAVEGQAEAWYLAVQHYKAMNKLTVGKSKVNELERKVNDLKKKTSLDTAVQKGNSKVSEESKLFNKAKAGSSADKEAFLRKRLNTDSFIPEEFRR